MDEKLADATKNTRKLRERESQNAASKFVPVLHDHKPRSQRADTTIAGSSMEDCIIIESLVCSDDDADDNDETPIADVNPSNVKEHSVVVSFETESRLRPKTLRRSDQTSKEIQPSKSNISQRQHPYRRSKRNIVPRKETAYGLLWKEEAELQRALNASIQAKRHKELPTLTSRERSSSSSSRSVESHNQKMVKSKPKNSQQDSDDVDDDCAKIGDCETADEDYGQSFAFFSSDSSVPNKHCSKTLVRAQRKFASSSSQLELLNFMSNKWTNRKSKKVKSTNGKTEDFLTYLCFRRTSVLPPQLECFKYDEGDSLQSFPSSSTPHGSSSPGTPVSGLGPSGDNSSISTPNPESSAKTPSGVFEMTKLKESKKKMRTGHGSSKFSPFQSRCRIRKRMNEQAKGIKNSIKRRNDTSKVACADTMHSASTESCSLHCLAPRQCLSNAVSPLTNSSEFVKTLSIQTEATPETSLKSRLRASTRALSAAVIKEQQMFARRSITNHLFTTIEENDVSLVGEPKKKSEAQLTQSSSFHLEKKKTKPNTDDSACSRDLQREKKLEIVSRLRSGAGIGCGPHVATTELKQAIGTKKLVRDTDECREFRTSSYLSSAASSATCCSANVHTVSVSQLPTFHPTIEQPEDFSSYTNE